MMYPEFLHQCGFSTCPVQNYSVLHGPGLLSDGPADGIHEHLLEILVLKILGDTERGVERAPAFPRVHPCYILPVCADVALLQNRCTLGQRPGLVEFA